MDVDGVVVIIDDVDVDVVDDVAVDVMLMLRLM